LPPMIYWLASISSWLAFILPSICYWLASILCMMAKVHQNYSSNGSNPIMHNSIQSNNSINLTPVVTCKWPDTGIGMNIDFNECLLL
jgi:hypothetical protein